MTAQVQSVPHLTLVLVWLYVYVMLLGVFIYKDGLTSFCFYSFNAQLNYYDAYGNQNF